MKSTVLVQKSIVFFFALSALLVLTTSPENAWGGEGKVSRVTLNVDGMTCFLCAPMVKKVLKKLDGVIKADVSVKEAKAEIDYKEGKVAVNQMIKAIEDIGFKASLLAEKDEERKQP